MFNKLAAAFVGKLFCLFVSCFFVELHANPINFLSNRRRFDIQRDTLLKYNPQKNKSKRSADSSNTKTKYKPSEIKKLPQKDLSQYILYFCFKCF
ncbi:hypothetical protein M2306_002264 [Myroides gitamensis]|uniref:Uncharacterized protein n=1 Tax=Myroides odoratus TaxID=256 RepID=A0A378U6L6_MYROD|nr:hypothetical protein [Myroides odoratus]MDH6601570.1 hypothetical protein [Myroides gitamensis]STZ69982.1 Uncharacterised protein [Myroides odoratus]